MRQPDPVSWQKLFGAAVVGGGMGYAIVYLFKVSSLHFIIQCSKMLQLHLLYSKLLLGLVSASLENSLSLVFLVTLKGPSLPLLCFCSHTGTQFI